MAGIQLKNGVVNQFGAPSINENTFANRPTFGQAGRIFISTDTLLIYRDTGTAWAVLSPAGTSATPGGSYDSFLGSSVQWNNGSGTFGGDSNFLYRDGSVDFKVPKGAFNQISGSDYGSAVSMSGATLSTSGGGANYNVRGQFTLSSTITAGSTSGTITITYGSLAGFYANCTNAVLVITPASGFTSTMSYIYNITSSSTSAISFTITNTSAATSLTSSNKFGYFIIL
jgi:hypothetical protein